MPGSREGAGNPVAVCGLAGALVVALLAGARAPRLVPMALLWWCGALLSLHWRIGPLVVCIAAAVAVQLTPAPAVPVGRLVAGAAILAALALAAARDIHGAACWPASCSRSPARPNGTSGLPSR